MVLINNNDKPLYIRTGDKIAQFVFKMVRLPTIVPVSSLSPTARGENGFGSTDTDFVKKISPSTSNTIQHPSDLLRSWSKSNEMPPNNVSPPPSEVETNILHPGHTAELQGLKNFSRMNGATCTVIKFLRTDNKWLLRLHHNNTKIKVARKYLRCIDPNKAIDAFLAPMVNPPELPPSNIIPDDTSTYTGPPL